MTDSRMPVISAVTPCLNDASHLPEMIESFLAQDYPHKELFGQDGGSTDGFHEILRRYPIRWSIARDTGPHDAINKGILASQGDIVVIMPANDLFAPRAFSRAVDELRARPDVAMVYGDCQILDEYGAVTRIDRPGTLDIDRSWPHDNPIVRFHLHFQAGALNRPGFLFFRAPYAGAWHHMGMNLRGIVLGSVLLVAASAVFYAQQKTRPAPFATPSANNRPRVVAKPEGAKLSVPTGFQVEIYQEGFKVPRFMLLGPSNEIQ